MAFLMIHGWGREEQLLTVFKAAQVKPTLAYSSYLQGGVSTFMSLSVHSEILVLS